VAASGARRATSTEPDIAWMKRVMGALRGTNDIT
jgi:hypothetical protein